MLVCRNSKSLFSWSFCSFFSLFFHLSAKCSYSWASNSCRDFLPLELWMIGGMVISSLLIAGITLKIRRKIDNSCLKLWKWKNYTVASELIICSWEKKKKESLCLALSFFFLFLFFIWWFQSFSICLILQCDA